MIGTSGAQKPKKKPRRSGVCVIAAESDYAAFCFLCRATKPSRPRST